MRKLSISAGAVVLTCVVLELVMRAQEPGPFSLVDRYPFVESEADLHVRHKPGFVGRWDSTWFEIDDRGFRGKTRPLQFGPDEVRIVCLGDSCTFGKGVLEEDTWPRQLESRLRSQGLDGSVVLNLGVNGGHTRVYAKIFEENVEELQPNLVVIGFNINDFPNTIRAVDEKVFNERSLRALLPQGVRDVFGRSALYRKIRAVYYDTQKKRDYAASEKVAAQAAEAGKGTRGATEKVWDLQREYLSSIRDLAADVGAEVHVFLFPYETQLFLDTFDRTPIDTLGGVCADLGMPFFDLTDRFRAAVRKDTPPKTLFIQGDRYHPNAAGYRIVADVVMEELVATGMVSLPKAGVR